MFLLSVCMPRIFSVILWLMLPSLFSILGLSFNVLRGEFSQFNARGVLCF